MSWTPATSIRARAAHPSRTRSRATSGVCESRPGREHLESTDLPQSCRKGSACPDLVGDPVRKDFSPRFAHLLSSRSTRLSPFFRALAHLLRADRGDAIADFLLRKSAYSAQFWCNLSPLDATLLDPFLCVANKELTQYLSPVDATLTKNRGVGVSSFANSVMGRSLRTGLGVFQCLRLSTFNCRPPLYGGTQSGVN